MAIADILTITITSDTENVMNTTDITAASVILMTSDVTSVTAITNVNEIMYGTD